MRNVDSSLSQPKDCKLTEIWVAVIFFTQFLFLPNARCVILSSVQKVTDKTKQNHPDDMWDNDTQLWSGPRELSTFPTRLIWTQWQYTKSDGKGKRLGRTVTLNTECVTSSNNPLAQNKFQFSNNPCPAIGNGENSPFYTATSVH